MISEKSDMEMAFEEKLRHQVMLHAEVSALIICCWLHSISFSVSILLSGLH